MAVQIGFMDPTIAGGASFPQAYCQIIGANLADLSSPLRVLVGIFVDQAHFAANNPPVFVQTVTMSAADTATLRNQFRQSVEQMLIANPPPPATGTAPAPAPYPPFTGGQQVA